ncbi:pyruvate decarboxylase [Piedraia hortae CBS 480.64]|uniref:Pyruvate decarboxylase n=1 Tax=Piedraia hortae CBS 480.64 TaxID=1314780 RepID=A0A6A7BVQ8_9PEZI|nr:pyruvate decarboxylase [Piedraia hortae CBS 480.64]
MPPKTVNVAEYLFTRLKQLGCESLHGLPGDFNLEACDYIQPSGLRWVGSCNELNAAYAADAYARVKGLGAILTTFGVGELSALNGIAGSYAELAPVVHIVGTPNRASQANGMMLHHTLGNGDFKVFAKFSENITVAQTNLNDPRTAATEIDRVLRACWVESKPVYVQLPTDMVTQLVDGSLLEKPIDLSPDSSDEDAEQMALSIVLEKLYAAKRPTLLVDGAAPRRGLMPAANQLIHKLKIPVFVAPMGKGAVDESLPNFVGLYAGNGSHPDVKRMIEESDLVLTLGSIKSDLNTHGFTYRLSQLSMIGLNYKDCEIGYARFARVSFKSLVPRLSECVDPSKLQPGATDIPKIPTLGQEMTNGEYGDDVITHHWLWPRLSSFLREGDLLITETGTSFMGYWETRLPRNVQVINQILWSSIGYGVGAAQGASLAAKDIGKGQRAICFEGDGSFQLTAQELSTIIRLNLDVTMFLIENDGYTIERYIHGETASYNDVSRWQYHKVPEALTSADAKVKPKSWKIQSRAELDRLLSDESFANGKGLQFVEIHMPKLDAPAVLKMFGKTK